MTELRPITKKDIIYLGSFNTHAVVDVDRVLEAKQLAKKLTDESGHGFEHTIKVERVHEILDLCFQIEEEKLHTIDGCNVCKEEKKC